jgi:ribosomal protein L29
MKSQDIRSKEIGDILILVRDLNKELLDYSLKVIQGSEKNVTKKRLLRKDLARMKTILREKVLLKSLEENKNE